MREGLFSQRAPSGEHGPCRDVVVAAVPPVSQYGHDGLGAARNGWLLYSSDRGHVDADRRRLAQAGLDVDALERADRLLIFEVDLSVDPDDWAEQWIQAVDEKLSAGFDAVWYARFPIPPTDVMVEAELPFEEAWMRRSRDRRVVTLCPYIVPETAAGAVYRHAGELAASHDDVLDLRGSSAVPTTGL